MESEGVRALTPMQQRVLIALAGGDSAKQAAARLGIHESTVKWHVRHARSRLGAGNTVQAAIIAERRGWLTEVMP